jgi:hypothetical protein
MLSSNADNIPAVSSSVSLQGESAACCALENANRVSPDFETATFPRMTVCAGSIDRKDTTPNA